jgi:hypothetical protein
MQQVEGDMLLQSLAKGMLKDVIAISRPIADVECPMRGLTPLQKEGLALMLLTAARVDEHLILHLIINAYKAGRAFEEIHRLEEMLKLKEDKDA